jgi:hypothetical protein
VETDGGIDKAMQQHNYASPNLSRRNLLLKVGAALMIGAAAVTFNLYHPTDAKAGGMSTITKDGKNEVITNYGPTGITADGKTVIIYNNNLQ